MAYTAGRNQVQDGASESYCMQSDLIVQCARVCFEKKGVQKTTMVNIAREANITRELIYYYFAGKDEIATHVIESYVEDSVETARLWCDLWKLSDSDSDSAQPVSREAMEDAVASIRRFVFQGDGMRRSMFSVLEELGERQAVFSQICERIMQSLKDHPMAQRVAVMFPTEDEETANLAFRFIMLGVIGLLESSNVKSDQQIADLLLHGVAKRHNSL